MRAVDVGRRGARDWGHRDRMTDMGALGDDDVGDGFIRVEFG